jgi:RHS repeat-associated protein
MVPAVLLASLVFSETIEPYHIVTSLSYPGGNLIANGSFENDYSDFEHEGWKATLLAGIDKQSYRPLPIGNTEKPYNGRRMAAVDFVVKDVTKRYLVSDPYSLQPNSWYTFFMKYRVTGSYAPASSARIHPYFQTFRSRDVDPVSAEQEETLSDYNTADGYAPSDVWTSYVYRFKTGPEDNYGIVSLLNGPVVGVGGIFYFDDLLLVKGCVRQSDSEGLPYGCNDGEDDVPFGKDPRHPDFVSKSRRFIDANGNDVQSSRQDGDRDIVSQNIFDELGRVSKNALPIGADFDAEKHAFVGKIKADNASGDILATYYTSVNPVPVDVALQKKPVVNYPDAGGAAYSELKYEASALARPVESARPGESWKMGSGRTVKTKYTSVPYLPNPEADALPASGEAGGEFYVTEVTNAEGKIRREYSDRAGRTMRVSNKLIDDLGTHWIKTEYQYDDKGNLVGSVSPSGADGLALTREFKYNDLNQMVSEKTPATGTTEFVYDAEGRQRFTRTEKQTASGRFSFIKYDSLGRTVRTGEITDAALFTPEKAQWIEFPCYSNCLEPGSVVEKSKVLLRNLNQYDAENPKLSCADDGSATGNAGQMNFLALSPAGVPLSCSDDLIWTFEESLRAANGISGTISVSALYGPSVIDPTVAPNSGSEISVDDPDLEYTLEGIPSVSAAGAPLQALYDGCLKTKLASSNASGNLIGHLVKSISCNYELAASLAESSPREVSKSYQYDRSGNATQVIEINRYIENGVKQVKMSKLEYDIGSKVTKSTECGDLVCSGPLSHVEKVDYDALGRVARIRDKNDATLVQNHYDFLGRLSLRSLGQDLATTSSNAVARRFGYHLQGWLTSILDNRFAGDAMLYEQRLFYEDGPDPKFDGSITRSKYSYSRMLTGEIDLDYTFSYDYLSRLSSADALSSTFGSRSTYYEYMNDGRLSLMDRGTASGTYQYDSKGRVSQVVGNLNSERNMQLPNTWGKVFDFDENGNLGKDYSKIVGGQPLEISYRDDNLPYKYTYLVRGATSGTYSTIKMFIAYDESGNRISKRIYENGELKSGKNYFRGSEVREAKGAAVSEFFDMAGAGRVRYSVGNPGGAKEFYLTDNLGSVRELYDFSTGNVTYASQYDPYGKQFGQITSAAPDVTPKFTGKEHDAETGLSNFGARSYDADIGLLVSPDPARQFSSPYAYIQDPLTSVDPDGRFFIDQETKNCEAFGPNFNEGELKHDDYMTRQSAYSEGMNLTIRNFNPAVMKMLTKIAVYTKEDNKEAWSTGNRNTRPFLVHHGKSAAHATPVYKKGDTFAAHGHPSNGPLSLNKDGAAHLDPKDTPLRGDLYHILTTGGRPLIAVGVNGDIWYGNEETARIPLYYSIPWSNSNKGSVLLGNVFQK